MNNALSANNEVQRLKVNILGAICGCCEIAREVMDSFKEKDALEVSMWLKDNGVQDQYCEDFEG